MRLDNNAPYVDAGNGYSVTEGNDIRLDASASLDLNSDVLTFAWDFDGDGEFDDATGPTPMFSAASLVGPDQQQVRVQVSDGILVSEASTVITIIIAPWRNPIQPLDINGDGHISPLDALMLINELNEPSITLAGSGLPALDARREVGPFYDPDGDNRLSPSDVLRIINYLNEPAFSEGESPTQSWPTEVDAVIPTLIDEHIEFPITPARPLRLQPKRQRTLRSTSSPRSSDPTNNVGLRSSGAPRPRKRRSRHPASVK